MIFQTHSKRNPGRKRLSLGQAANRQPSYNDDVVQTRFHDKAWYKLLPGKLADAVSKLVS